MVFNFNSLTSNQLVQIDQALVKRNSNALLENVLEKREDCRNVNIATLKLKREFGGHFPNTQLEIKDGQTTLKFGNAANNNERQQAQSYFNEHQLGEKVQRLHLQQNKCSADYINLRKEMINYGDIVRYLKKILEPNLDFRFKVPLENLTNSKDNTQTHLDNSPSVSHSQITNGSNTMHNEPIKNCSP